MITEEDYKEMKNLTSLSLVVSNGHFVELRFAVNSEFGNTINMRTFDLARGNEVLFFNYRKPKFQKPSDDITRQIKLFVKGYLAACKHFDNSEVARYEIV